MDLVWYATMASVWSGKPTKNAAAWKGFDHIHSFVLFLSGVNIVLKGLACGLLFIIMRGGKKSQSNAGGLP